MIRIVQTGRSRMSARQPSASVTELLLKAGSGDSSALSTVFPLIYEELRRLAQQQLDREPDRRTLSPTALVHKAYMRLVGSTRMEWTGRARFMAIAASAMRRMLIDHASAYRSMNRGTVRRVDIESADLTTEARAEVLLALDEALDRLTRLDRRKAQVVECRYFGGMTEEETADALGIALRTVKLDWAKAKGRLHRQIAADLSA